MLNYKISYRKEWSEDGTTYRQMITIFVPNKMALNTINLDIKGYRETSGSWMAHTYLKELKEGKNYTTLTTAEYVIVNYLNPDDKRIKRDRNTIINVKIVG